MNTTAVSSVKAFQDDELLLVENKITNRRVNLHSEHPRRPKKRSA